jgi:hypothetical protein
LSEEGPPDLPREVPRGESAEHPGPVPAGLVVRGQGEGFYARVWPKPYPPASRLVPAVTGIAAISAAVGYVAGSDPMQQLTVGASIALFGVLLGGFALGAGFVPVEITADDHQISWSGERFPVTVVGDCAVRGRALELVGRDGRVLARIDGLTEAQARWLSIAVRASIPVDRPS